MKTFWISMGKRIPKYLHTVTEGSVWEGKVIVWGLLEGSGHKFSKKKGKHVTVSSPSLILQSPSLKQRESPRFFLNNTPGNEKLKQPEWNKAHTSHGQRRQRMGQNWLEKEEKYRIAAFTWLHCFSRICTIQWMLFCCCFGWFFFFHPFITIFKCVSCKQIFLNSYIPISPSSCVSLLPSLSHPSRWSQSTELISLGYAAASH